MRRHDFGGNFGGPLVPRGDLRSKLFFFPNYEQEYIPQTTTQDERPHAEAQQGIFRYATARANSATVNVLQLAAAAGFPGTIDPTIGTMLAEQARARSFGTQSTTPAPMRSASNTLSWLEPQKQTNYYPTVRLDYHMKQNLKLMASYNRYNQDAQGRRIWPMDGYPIQVDTFDAGWWITSTGIELDAGLEHAQRVAGRHPAQRRHERARPRARALLRANGVVNGLPARFTLPFGLSPLSADQAPVIGKHYITTISDTFTYVRGSHTLELRRQLPRHAVAGSVAGWHRLGRLPRPAPLLVRGWRRAIRRQRLHDHDGARAATPTTAATSAVRATGRPPLAGANRQGRRSGDAAVHRRHLP